MVHLLQTYEPVYWFILDIYQFLQSFHTVQTLITGFPQEPTDLGLHCWKNISLYYKQVYYTVLKGLTCYSVCWYSFGGTVRSSIFALHFTFLKTRVNIVWFSIFQVPTASLAMDTGAALNHCRWHQNGHTIAVGDDMGHIYTYEIAEVHIASHYLIQHIKMI